MRMKLRDIRTRRVVNFYILNSRSNCQIYIDRQINLASFDKIDELITFLKLAYIPSSLYIEFKNCKLFMAKDKTKRDGIVIDLKRKLVLFRSRFMEISDDIFKSFPSSILKQMEGCK